MGFQLRRRGPRYTSHRMGRDARRRPAVARDDRGHLARARPAADPPRFGGCGRARMDDARPLAKEAGRELRAGPESGRTPPYPVNSPAIRPPRCRATQPIGSSQTRRSWIGIRAGSRSTTMPVKRSCFPDAGLMSGCRINPHRTLRPATAFRPRSQLPSLWDRGGRTRPDARQGMWFSPAASGNRPT